MDAFRILHKFRYNDNKLSDYATAYNSRKLGFDYIFTKELKWISVVTQKEF